MSIGQTWIVVFFAWVSDAWDLLSLYVDEKLEPPIPIVCHF